MNSLEIFATQLSLSVLAVSMLAKWSVMPWLEGKSLKNVLMILIAPHAMRHVGLTFLVPSIVDPGIAQSFTHQAAYGDFISGLLAIATLVLLKKDRCSAIAAVWIFNIVGTVDLLNALSQAAAVPYLGGTWYIPTFFVPILLVTHFLIFVKLFQHHRGTRSIGLCSSGTCSE